MIPSASQPTHLISHKKRDFLRSGIGEVSRHGNMRFCRLRFRLIFRRKNPPFSDLITRTNNTSFRCMATLKLLKAITALSAMSMGEEHTGFVIQKFKRKTKILIFIIDRCLRACLRLPVKQKGSKKERTN